MRSLARPYRFLAALGATATLVLPVPASANVLPGTFDFATPAFHISVRPGGGLMVADAGAGIWEINRGASELIAALPGATDVAAMDDDELFAVTGGGPEPPPDAAKLYKVRGGESEQLADLYQFEATVNPDGSDIIDTNPYSIAMLNPDDMLIADAGGNVLMSADEQGALDWVALFRDEVVSTDNIKRLAGCPNPVPELAFACDLPATMPAQPVPTSIAIGPDGDWYVGELKGFPAPTGESRIWRIDPDASHADCATSSACTVVADGFTSIVDLNFGPDDTLYVTEIDEASWAAVEFGLGMAGGTVNACSIDSWECEEVATGLPMAMSTTVHRDDILYALISGLVPGEAKVIALEE